MNEPAGSTVMVDSSGNGNNGTLHNVSSGAAGHSGTAYKFGGPQMKSYVEVPDSPSLNPGAAAINITLWLNTQSLPTSGDYDQLLIDGAVAGSSTKVAGSISNTSPVEIGAHPGSDWYKGRLDDGSITVG
jgi:hypothetical protein